MKDRITITLIIALAAVPIAGIWGSVEMRKLARRAPLSETEAALAYACGYRTGQYATMRAMPALFPSPEPPDEACARWTVIAAQKGFNS